MDSDGCDSVNRSREIEIVYEGARFPETAAADGKLHIHADSTRSFCIRLHGMTLLPQTALYINGDETKDFLQVTAALPFPKFLQPRYPEQCTLNLVNTGWNGCREISP